MMEPEKMLGLLLHTTEQQSETTEKLLAELSNHVAALVAATKSATDTSPALQKDVGDAARKAVAESLADGPRASLAAFKAASAPVVKALEDATVDVGIAVGKLNAAGRWFGWQVAGIVAGLVVVAGLLGWGVIAWERSQVSALETERAALVKDVAQLKADFDLLEKHVGKSRKGK
jgi:hypothetical protein